MATTEFGDPAVISLPATTEFGDTSISNSGQIPVENTDLAQKIAAGYQPTRAEVQQLSAQRLVERERAAGFRPGDLLLAQEANQLAAQAGIPGLPEGVNVISTSQIGSPAIRNVLALKEAAGAAGLGLAPAIQKLIEDAALNPAQQQIFGQSALRARAPDITSGAQLVGSLVPIGGGAGAVAVAPTLLRQVASGIGRGAAYGATTGGAGQVAETGTQTTLPQLIQSSLIGGGIGGAIGGAAPVILPTLEGAIRTAINAPRAIANIPGRVVSGLERVQERMAPASVEQSAMAALDLTKSEVNQHIPIVTQRVSQLVGTTPKTAEEAINAINQAKQQLYNDRLEINNAATENGLVLNGNAALQQAEDVLNPLTTIKPQKKTEILNNLRDLYSGDKTPNEAQKIQQDLNDKFSAAYANGTIDRADAAFQAEKAIRDSYASQMDELNKSLTGINETPYSDIGSLIEVGGSLQDKLNAIEGAIAKKKTGIESRPSKIPATKYQAIYQAKKTILSPLQKSQLEKFNQNVQKIFEESPKQPSGNQLTNEEMSALQNQFLPTISSLDQKIQALIKTYPKDIQSNPALARRIAEADLTQAP